MKGGKRKGAPGDSTSQEKKANLQGASTANTTKTATTVRPTTTTAKQQEDGSHPQPEVQLPSTKGNLPNTGGTLSGEAGSRKQQKENIHFGYIKVRMNSFKYNSKHFCFLFTSKEQAYNIKELMGITYEHGNIIGFKYEKTIDESNYLYYILVWNLPFNIGLTKLFEKLGTKIQKIKFLTYNYVKAQDVDEADVTKDKIEKITNMLTCKLINGVIINTCGEELNADKLRKSLYDEKHNKSQCEILF